MCYFQIKTIYFAMFKTSSVQFSSHYKVHLMFVMSPYYYYHCYYYYYYYENLTRLVRSLRASSVQKIDLLGNVMYLTPCGCCALWRWS